MGNKDLYRLFFEESSDALIAISLETKQVLAINKSFSGLIGFERDELLGESANILNSVFPEDQSHDRGLELKIFENPGYYNDIAINTRDNELKYVTVKVSHTLMANKKIALAVLSDDTERLLLMRDLATKHYSLETAYVELEKVHSELQTTQNKMLQASKLVALGELAAGVSHELNQPLTGVRGFAQEIADIVKNDANPDKKLLADLCNEITTNSDKMADLLSHLRSFAREEKKNLGENENDKKVVPLNDTLKNVTKLLDKQLKSKNINIDVRGDLEDTSVLAQAHPIEQILINLIANGRDAILDRRNSDEKLSGHILINVDKKADFIELRVSDNGCGVPKGIQEQIFNPFFTTKDPNKGMGLGLSLSFSIAHRFGGELSLESSSGSGSTFLLKLQNAQKQKKSEEVAA
ncbi:PAS domain S-box protein [bacterium]|nr:PAS domain S-box protein [bacterium]